MKTASEFDLMLASNTDPSKCVFYRLSRGRTDIASVVLASNSREHNERVAKNWTICRQVNDECRRTGSPELAPGPVDIRETNGLIYVEQEYLPLRSLGDHMRNSSQAQLATFAREVTAAICAFQAMRLPCRADSLFLEAFAHQPVLREATVFADNNSFSRPRYEFLQHGDLFTGNILVDEKETQLKWIDWDFASSGYPPLFDMFSFLTSISYSDPSNNGDAIEFYERTYFSDSALRTIAANCLQRASQEAGLHDLKCYHLFYLMEVYARYLALHGIEHPYTKREQQRLSFFARNHSYFLSALETRTV